jgi:hypothetical protein
LQPYYVICCWAEYTAMSPAVHIILGYLKEFGSFHCVEKAG